MESNQFAPSARAAGQALPDKLPVKPEAGSSAGNAEQFPWLPLPGYGESEFTGNLEPFPEFSLQGYNTSESTVNPTLLPGNSLTSSGGSELEGNPVLIPGTSLPDSGAGEPAKGLEVSPASSPTNSGEGDSEEGPEQSPVPFLPACGVGGTSKNSSLPQAYIRFLNAVVDDGSSLRITLGSRLLATSLANGNLTAYATVPSGFHTLIFYDAQFPWVMLYRSNLSLAANEVVTLAVVRSGGGIDLVRVDDRPCGGAARRACLRMVNLVYNSPGLDLILTDGRVVFTDIRFKEVSAYRRARPGRYDMYVAQTPCTPNQSDVDIETVEEMPIMISNYFLPGCGVVEPLAAFYLEARAGARDSIYLMGNWDISPRMQVRIVENT